MEEVDGYDRVYHRLIKDIKSSNKTGLDFNQLFSEIIRILVDNTENENKLQSDLFDLLGFENIEIISEIITNSSNKRNFKMKLLAKKHNTKRRQHQKL